MNKLKIHSIHIVILLLATLALGSVGLGIFIQTNPFIKVFDDSLYTFISQNYHSQFLDILITPFNFNFIKFAGLFPSYLYILLFGALTYLIFFKRSLVGWFLFSVFLGSLIAIAITALDWHFVFRQRPFVSLPNQVSDIGKAAWVNFSSFPSGHTRETTLFGTIVASYIPYLKIPMILFILFIAYSRVYIGAHYPTDVISGIIIGFLAARVSLIISREIQIMRNERGQTHSRKPKPERKDED